MTVTYGDRSFLSLLFRWRGSIWKSVLKQYIVFLVLYFAINLSYRFGIKRMENHNYEVLFNAVVNKFGLWTTKIPIQFLLGFYVSSVVARWWDQLNMVAWPDKFLLLISGNINGLDDESRMIRRTFARYANLLNAFVWKEISLKVKKRIPTDYHLVKYGLMTEDEYETYTKTTSVQGRWFVPVSWMVNLLHKCKEEGRVSDFAQQNIINTLYDFRGCSGMLTVYDWVSIPLVYTQVVTIATYGYFTFCLIARQSIVSGMDSVADEGLEIYFPFFTTLEFIFYIGWLKVGEELRCPFNEGDEDFDMNYILDRNIHVGFMITDELNAQRPQLVKDKWWDERHPTLPHTKASCTVRDRIPNWRLQKYQIDEHEQEFQMWDELVEAHRKKHSKKGSKKVIRVNSEHQHGDERRHSAGCAKGEEVGNPINNSPIITQHEAMTMAQSPPAYTPNACMTADAQIRDGTDSISDDRAHIISTPPRRAAYTGAYTNTNNRGIFTAQSNIVHPYL